ncbi:hypothetical protein C8J56DRAFT_722224, partial [Mycena floridula]
ICRFCDQPLPAYPTQYLRRLLGEVYQQGLEHVRPSNPYGLRASLAVFGQVCARHQYEAKTVPLAKLEGWPSVIDWARIPARIESMKEEFKAIIED